MDFPNVEYHDKIVLVKTEEAAAANFFPGKNVEKRLQKFFSMHELCETSPVPVTGILFEQHPHLQEGARPFAPGKQLYNPNYLIVFPVNAWEGDILSLPGGGGILRQFIVPIKDCEIVGELVKPTEKEMLDAGLDPEDAQDYDAPKWNEGFDKKKWLK